MTVQGQAGCSGTKTRERLGEVVGRQPKTAGLHDVCDCNWSSGKLRILNGPLTPILVVYAAKSIRRVLHEATMQDGKESRKCQCKSRRFGAGSRLGRRCYSR